MSLFEFTEESMINLVATNQSLFCTSYEIAVPNCYTTHDNEADLFCIRSSGFCDEFEIKLTRSDFFNDAKKSVNYRDCDWNGVDSDFLKNNPNWQREKLLAPWQKLKHQALIDGDMPTNYFWYILKSGIVELTEVPEWAGVFFVNDAGELIRQRQPKRLHKEKLSHEFRYKISRKLAYRYWDYVRGLINGK